MGFAFRSSEQQRITDDARRFLGAWQVDFPGNRELWIKPQLSDLTYADLCDLIERLVTSGIVGDVEFVFDCCELRTVETPWTAVFALWLHLARMAPRGCRLTALSGQPAAMAALAFRGVPQSLIRIEPRPSRGAA